MKLKPVQSAFLAALGIAVLLPILKFIYGSKPNFLQDSILSPIAFFFVFWLANTLIEKKKK